MVLPAVPFPSRPLRSPDWLNVGLRRGIDQGQVFEAEHASNGVARLRVNVELIDTESGGHLWAERFDGDTGELFDIQDEIVARVARALDVELTAAEARRAERGYAADLDSIDFTFRGYAAFNRSLSPENLTEADQLFETALTLDPRNAQALVGRALARLAFASSYTRDERATHLATAETAAVQALALAPNYAKAHRALGEIYIYTNRTMLGVAEVEQAIALDRNHAHAYAMLGLAQVALGHAEEAEGRVAQAFRLSPRDAFAYLWCANAGAAWPCCANAAARRKWVSG